MATTNLDLPKERNLYLQKQVDQASMGDLSQKIIEINDDDERLRKLYHVYGIDYTPKPIKMYIDSYGGSVYQCFGLLSVMDNSKTEVHTIVTGCAMSCGFMILISGHKRFAHKLSTPLYHQVSTRTSGTLKEIEDDIMETKRLQETIEKITLDRTKISKKKLKEVYDGKVDWFMTADEAKDLGVVDEIL